MPLEMLQGLALSGGIWRKLTHTKI